MQDKIRQWFVDNPRAMDFAFMLTLGSSIVFELGTQEAGGSTMGP